MEPLFDNTATAEDDKYNFICNDTEAKSAKNYTESLWAKYHPYADLNFREQIRRCFDERFWEMYLTCTLMDKGYELIRKTKKYVGPDIRVEHKGNIIWIEATTPTAGNESSRDRVPELVITKPPTAQRVPEEQIILRYRAAIKEKYDGKYSDYLNKGIIGKEDFYIIAINGCQIPHSKTDFHPPRIVRSVLPFGYPKVTIDTVSMQKISEGFEYRAQVSKAGGIPVETDIFLDSFYQHINAILFSNVDVFNLTKSMGDDFIAVHNPLARSLPDSFLDFGEHWKAQLLGDEVALSWER